MGEKGRPVPLEIKKIIPELKHYFDSVKVAPEEENLPSVNRVATALNLGVATIRRIMADYNKDPNFYSNAPQKRGRPNRAISESCQSIARSFIRNANKEGRHITLEALQNHLEQEYGSQDYNVRTLGRALDRWGFTFGKGTRSANLKEKNYVIAARRRYLRRKIANRIDKDSTHRSEVYLDESYINKNHSNDYIWCSDDDGPWTQKPTGKGERLIILNAMTQNGWVPNAKLIFKSKKKTGDYHGQMNFELFSKWFKEKLLPNIPEKSLIIMDNATYHNVLASNSAPTANCKKENIRSWLEKNSHAPSEDCLKAELIESLNKLSPAPTYAIDKFANEYGHEILRTPQYHPELQPIETCWAVVKNEVANKCDFSMANLILQLDDAFEKVTAKTCSGLIKKVQKTEDDFWKNDTDFQDE